MFGDVSLKELPEIPLQQQRHSGDGQQDSQNPSEADKTGLHTGRSIQWGTMPPLTQIPGISNQIYGPQPYIPVPAASWNATLPVHSAQMLKGQLAGNLLIFGSFDLPWPRFRRNAGMPCQLPSRPAEINAQARRTSQGTAAMMRSFL